MALSLDYVVRETGYNLWRNKLMTGAAVLTVAVSLFLAGGALLLTKGVGNATVQWKNGVELSIFMQPDATPEQTDAIARELAKMPEVKKITYVDQDAAYSEFKRMFANDPDMVQSVTAKDLPPSYRVVPRQAQFVETIGIHFSKSEGVKKVVYARDTVKTLLTVTHLLNYGIWFVAVILLLSAAVLILNSIRMAIYARRREVAVMKLVGATNWFIQVPFMLEGMVQGMVGALVAFAFCYGFRDAMAHFVRANSLQLINQMVVTSGQVVVTGIEILLIGAVVGAGGSIIAVRRFLDV